jgi:hypothetical protein
MKTKKRFTTGTRTHPTKGPVTAIAWSAASRNSGHNFENPDLDAIWPANLIGDASAPALVELANDTLDTRIHRESYDWHPTTVQAARLGRADVYQSALRAGIAKFLLYRQGFGTYGGGASGDIQTEFTAVQTFAAHQALVQNYDGLLRLSQHRRQHPRQPPTRQTVARDSNSLADFRSGGLARSSPCPSWPANPEPAGTKLTTPFFPALQSTPPPSPRLRRPRRLPPSLKLPPSPEAMADKTADKTTGRPVRTIGSFRGLPHKANSLAPPFRIDFRIIR